MITIKYNGQVTIETDTPPSPPSQAGVWMTSNCDGIKVKSKGPLIVYTLPSDKMVGVGVTYQDSKGRPAEVDGDVVWSSSDEAIVTVTVDATNSKLAKILPADNLGQVQVIATADADLGDGIVEIICTMDITVVAGQAVVGVIEPIGPAHPIA